MAKFYINGALKEYTNGGFIYRRFQQRRKFLRVGAVLALVAILTTFYMFADLTAAGYLSFITQMEGFGSDDTTMFFSYLNSSLAGKPPAGYIVWSPSCRIPDVPTLHDSIKKFVYTVKPTRCTNAPYLTTISRTNNGSHVLLLHRKVAAKHYKESKPNCCYSLITRVDSPANTTNYTKVDDNYSIGKCIDFTDNVTFSKEEQFVKVKCLSSQKKKKEIYNNMHAFVRKTKAIESRIVAAKEPEVTSSDGDKKLSVMIVGIDSVSRLNLLRTMPKTAKHLQQNAWISLKGYNKMDDNTFPNLMAILTGRTMKQVTQLCWQTRKEKLDNCPLIWNNYSSNGYVTCYAEDEPTIGSFNYLKAGFLKTPTDYYLRPFMLVAEKYLKLKSLHYLNVCLGPTPTTDFILDYAIDFANTFKDRLAFSLFWMNSYSHNDLNTPSLIDVRMVRFFHDLANTGALNNTLVLFLSDHGMRFGQIRETYVGWLEERLPFLYIWLPEWFRKSHSDKLDKLLLNADRLTSPFDVHVTLNEVLGYESQGPPGCPSCQSLFEEVPWNRTCYEAGITDHWCTCSEYKTLSLDSAPVKAIARHVLGEVNRLVEKGVHNLSNRTRCAKLKIKRILSLRSKIFSKGVGHAEYVILLQTLPGEAMFEATVRHKNQFKIMDTVSRINTYGAQSKCMNDAFLKKYCYCEYL